MFVVMISYHDGLGCLIISVEAVNPTHSNSKPRTAFCSKGCDGSVKFAASASTAREGSARYQARAPCCHPQATQDLANGNSIICCRYPPHSAYHSRLMFRTEGVLQTRRLLYGLFFLSIPSCSFPVL